MLILITYDVSTGTSVGKKRLNNVAKICLKHGQRVQNSVFECNIDYSTFLELKIKLVKIIDQKTDSLRFYNLGNKHENRVEHVGIKPSIPLEGILVF